MGHGVTEQHVLHFSAYLRLTYIEIKNIHGDSDTCCFGKLSPVSSIAFRDKLSVAHLARVLDHS